jgi:hypothetical protein
MHVVRAQGGVHGGEVVLARGFLVEARFAARVLLADVGVGGVEVEGRGEELVALAVGAQAVGGAAGVVVGFPVLRAVCARGERVGFGGVVAA